MAPSVPPAPGSGTPSAPAEAAHMTTTTIKVDGMTCGACTSAVESAFQGVNGAGEVSVSLMMGRAVVQHDPEVLSAEKVAEIIEDRGFDAEVLSTDIPRKENGKPTKGSIPSQCTTTLSVQGMTCGACTSAIEGGFTDVPGVKSATRCISWLASMRSSSSSSAQMKSTVSIDGMTCGACTSAVENAVTGLPGLIRFNISLLAERAVVVHDPSVLPALKISEAIEDTGFDTRILFSEPDTSINSTSSTPLNFNVYGLTDAASAADLEDILLKTPGILSASVRLSNSQASVSFNPSQVGIRAVAKMFEDAGYNALLTESDDNNAQLESLAKTREIHEWRKAFLLSLSFAIPVMLISMIFPMYLHFLDFGSVELIPGLFLGDVACMFLTIPVQFGIGLRFYRAAFKSLRHRSPTMDVLIMLSTSLAFSFSILAMLVSVLLSPHSKPSTVFETSTMLITFITLGRWLENRAKGHTSRALSRLMSLTPSMATIYDDPVAAEKAAESWKKSCNSVSADKPEATSAAIHSGQKIIPTELIQVGDIVCIRPGDKIAADGVVIRGEMYVDESMVTGEAIPIIKTSGHHVIAGTVNGTGWADFQVTRAGRDTQLSQIVKLVQEAQTNRAPIQRMADTVAGYFVPTIITLGFVTFIGWMILSHLLPHPPKIFLVEGSGGTLMVCLKICISVIVFACPCALGLSTPTAVMVGTGVGAEHGILVKGGAALEAATKIKHVIFDKTGTITMGKTSVAEAKMEPTWSTNEWRRQLWWLIVGLTEMTSEHPIGKTIVSKAKSESGISDDGPLDGAVVDFEAMVGKGVSATVEPTSGPERQQYTSHIGNAVFMRSKGIKIPDSTDSDIKKRKSKSEALKTATKKQAIISKLQTPKYPIAMVGDGINDSIPLATASVGIALSSGTEVAMEAADIVLMRPEDLLSVPASLCLSRSIFNRIKLNLLWACIYNAIGIPFAMGLFLPFGGVSLHPMAAGAAMAASSVSVVVSSLLLKFWRRPSWLKIERLEREVDEGLIDSTGQAYGKVGKWWKKSPFASPVSPAENNLAGAFRFISRAFGRRSTPTEEDGYVPLQTVDNGL
ncbi:copper-transporting ATPase [Trichophyton equinum CBS 127.97]|uniref:P-type Cu(+) transporter n=1 Tax=Trichophyton equinum (strain ATCC MYA-4606 / CBS 127.97) TaxID=559882 RepID=F2PMD4_TRIEC|nr:copper-transporting ATPase [Trichophyton equinum CBS 127.97]